VLYKYVGGELTSLSKPFKTRKRRRRRAKKYPERLRKTPLSAAVRSTLPFLGPESCVLQFCTSSSTKNTLYPRIASGPGPRLARSSIYRIQVERYTSRHMPDKKKIKGLPTAAKSPTFWQRFFEEGFKIHLVTILQDIALRLVILAGLAVVYLVLRRLEVLGILTWYIKAAETVDGIFMLVNVSILGLDSTGKAIILMWSGWRKAYAEAI
jgi:hypothetical protein